MFESFDTISAAQVPTIGMRYSETWKLDEPASCGPSSCLSSRIFSGGGVSHRSALIR